MTKIDNASKALDLLKEYDKGTNPVFDWYYNSIYVYKNMKMNDFSSNFIIDNINFKPKQINKIVKISEWYRERLKEKLQTDFTPEKINITWLLGETDSLYCCYIFYRRSQNKPKMIFIPKNAILNDLFSENYKNMDVDFEKYDRLSKNKGIKLKEHQKIGIKFMLSSKKCINADSMGAGKTIQAIISAIEGGSKKILIICPASLKTNWKREIENYQSETEIEIVNGKKWEESTFTIMNYDILDNFYEIPQEIAYETVKDVDENNNIIEKVQQKWQKKPKFDKDGNIIEDGIPKMKISRNKQKIQEAMNNSQLFQSKFDCVIIDEAHKLCNSTSTRYKVIKDFLKRSNPKYIFMITGTPISNRPMNFYNLLKLIDHPVTKDYQYYIKRYCNAELIYLKGEKWKWTSVFLKQHNKKWKELTESDFKFLDMFLIKNAKHIWKTNGSSNLDELHERTKNVYIRRLTSDFGDMVTKKTIEKYYDFNFMQQTAYNEIWEEYKKSQDYIKQEEIEKYKQIIEGTILRQFIAREMIQNTIDLSDEYLENDESQKIVIMCTFDEEIEKFKNYYKEKCVTYNGKMSIKQKDEAQYKFKTDPNVRLFIGNIIASGVGLNLEVANILIFNSFSFVSGENFQASDRVYRLTQQKDCTVIYQLFNDSFATDMYKYVLSKQENIDEVIKKEDDK